jgi:hypothetical protein
MGCLLPVFDIDFFPAHQVSVVSEIAQESQFPVIPLLKA